MQTKMFVRYLGDKVCWTVLDETERFYIGDVQELTDEERLVCDAGGGELPLSFPIDVASQ